MVEVNGSGDWSFFIIIEAFEIGEDMDPNPNKYISL